MPKPVVNHMRSHYQCRSRPARLRSRSCKDSEQTPPSPAASEMVVDPVAYSKEMSTNSTLTAPLRQFLRLPWADRR
jgi:hypothetical protein